MLGNGCEQAEGMIGQPGECQRDQADQQCADPECHALAPFSPSGINDAVQASRRWLGRTIDGLQKGRSRKAAAEDYAATDRRWTACRSGFTRESDAVVPGSRAASEHSQAWASCGLTTAVDMSIKKSTVKTYRNRAFERLGINFRSQVFALCEGVRGR